MKCGHCGAGVDRREWFCSNCKRSTQRVGRKRLGAVQVAACAAAGLALGAAGLSLSSRPPAQSPPAVSAARVVPVVRVQPVAKTKKPVPSQPAPVVEAPPVTDAIVPVALTEATPVESLEAPPPPTVTVRPSGTGTLSVTTDPPVDTFVYLNGGTLLGHAPLQATAIPAGRHTLVFWAPSIGGRSTRTVDVEPGEAVEVVEKISPQNRFVAAAEQ
ncbi:MAG TPA: PEGA domain-containing protein [Armatimonadota bacterium]|nr:PEGA domain-containing protein [Armatimonadota bacterium]